MTLALHGMTSAVNRLTAQVKLSSGSHLAETEALTEFILIKKRLIKCVGPVCQRLLRLIKHFKLH